MCHRILVTRMGHYVAYTFAIPLLRTLMFFGSIGALVGIVLELV